MCGRYAIRQTLAEICATFGTSTALADFPPSYNAAPESARVLIARERAGTGIWGWPVAAGLSPVINIRCESAADKPMFAASWRAGRRCIAPASGFYEWDADGQPFYVNSPDVPLMGLCGLWTRDPDHSVRFAVLTQAAIPTLAAIHPRMPVIATPGAARAWLAEGALPPLPALRFHPVSRAVNDARADSPDLVMECAAPQGSLFAAQKAG